MRLLYLLDADGASPITDCGHNFVTGFFFRVTEDRLEVELADDLPDEFFSLHDQPSEMQLRDAVRADESRVEAVSAIIGQNGAGKTMMARRLAGAGLPWTLMLIEKQKTIYVYGAKKIEVKTVSDVLRRKGYKISDCRGKRKSPAPYEFVYYTPFCATQKVLPRNVANVHDLSPAALLDGKSVPSLGILEAPEMNVEDPNTVLSQYDRRLQEEVVLFVHDYYAYGMNETSRGEFPMPHEADISDDRMLMVELSGEFKKGIKKNSLRRLSREEQQYQKLMAIALRSTTFATMGFAILKLILLLLHEKRKKMKPAQCVVCGIERLCAACVAVKLFIVKTGRDSPHYDVHKHSNTALKWWHLLSDEQRHVCYVTIEKALEKLSRAVDPKIIAWKQILIMWRCLSAMIERDKAEADDDLLLCTFDNETSYRNFVDLMVAQSKAGLKYPCLRVNLRNVSSGEMAYLSMFARLHRQLKELGYARLTSGSAQCSPLELLLFMDEAETTLHPAWQRELVANIIWYFEGFTNDVRAHVIFASHSPLLLSDLPKGNVVLLEDKGREDFERLSNTFGANIFDLYRLSYFLKEGTTGRFAQEKIDKLVGHVFSRVQQQTKDGVSKRERQLAKMVGDEPVRAYLENWIAALDGKR